MESNENKKGIKSIKSSWRKQSSMMVNKDQGRRTKLKGKSQPREGKHKARRVYLRASLSGTRINGFDVQFTGTEYCGWKSYQYTESLRRFQHALEACGVNKALIKHGVKEGDTVIVDEMEMVWHDAAEGVHSSGPRRQEDGSVKWPRF